MKKILLIISAVIVFVGLVAFMVYKQQSGYTKVLTGKVNRQDLATVVSGTGQIKPKTYVNLGATAMGRITHFYVKAVSYTHLDVYKRQSQERIAASSTPPPPGPSISGWMETAATDWTAPAKPRS